MSGTEVAVAGGGGFLATVTDEELAELGQEAQRNAGAGTSQDREDNLMPFVVVLQDMSPQVKKREPTYIDGAEPGMILRTDIKKLYKSLLFQPVVFDKKVVEWVPRDAGGGGGKGFVATHDKMPADAINPTKDGKVLKNAWISEKTGHNYVETRYHYGNILDEDTGAITPAVIGMSATGHSVSRSWMSLMNQFRVGGVIAPSWFRCYEIGTEERRNAQGNWFVFSVRDRGWVSKPLREIGEALSKAVTSGEKVAAQPHDTGEAETDKEIPF